MTAARHDGRVAPSMDDISTEGMGELERKLVMCLRTGRAALPVLPRVASVALSLASDPRAKIQDLARLVDTDPPIAARFLSMTNSVAYWRGYLAASTQAAIVRLGLANTRDLLFQVVYAGSTRGLERYQNAVENCFRRSVMAAVACKITAEELRIGGEYDYMAGLLHDIGEARIYRILDDIPKHVKLDQREVRQLVHRYHCAAGAEVAMAWQLPSEIVDACAAHHDDMGTRVPHVRLVMIADALVGILKSAPVRQPLNVDTDELGDLGVEPEMALHLLERTREAVGVVPPRI